MPASGDVIYTFSSGSGTSAIGFHRHSPEFPNLAVGEFDEIPGNALASSSIGLPPGGPNLCSSVTLAEQPTGEKFDAPS